MKTNQIMLRPMGDFKVAQRTKDGYFDANVLLKQWNENNSEKRISRFLDSPKTKEFISVLESEISPSTHSLAERKINDLVQTLNDDLKPKQHYKLISADEIKGDLILLTASNENDTVLNIVNFNGDIPPNNVANWRTISTVIKELGEDAPEPLFRMRIFEINQELITQGKNLEEIDKFWKEIFANQK